MPSIDDIFQKVGEHFAEIEEIENSIEYYTRNLLAIALVDRDKTIDLLTALQNRMEKPDQDRDSVLWNQQLDLIERAIDAMAIAMWGDRWSERKRAWEAAKRQENLNMPQRQARKEAMPPDVASPATGKKAVIRWYVRGYPVWSGEMTLEEARVIAKNPPETLPRGTTDGDVFDEDTPEYKAVAK
jgi:hypothetical protein